jgi:hypothetical protein
LLEKAEQYERTTSTPTQQQFLKWANINTVRKGHTETLSVHQFRTWRRHYGMDYPLVPTMDEWHRPIVVYLVDAYDNTLLWISSNVCEVLGKHRWQVINHDAMDALSHGRDPRQTDPQLCEEFRALRAGELEHSAPPPAYMVHDDGHLVPVQLNAGHGDRSRAWYIQATVLGDTAMATPPKEHAPLKIPRWEYFNFTMEDYERLLPPYVYRGGETSSGGDEQSHAELATSRDTHHTVERLHDDRGS